MGLGCGMSLIKYVLFVFNLLCALCGIALLAIGIIYIIDLNDFDKITEELNILSITAIILALGAIIFLIAFLGCCGAIRESYCMVLTYSISVGLLLVAKIVIAIIVLVKREDVQKEVEKVFSRIWSERADNNTQIFINNLQETLECCGLNSYADYNPTIVYPVSCCPSGVAEIDCTSPNVFPTGCGKAIEDWIQTGAAVIGGVALGVAAVELVALIFSCCLANSIRRSKRHA